MKKYFYVLFSISLLISCDNFQKKSNTTITKEKSIAKYTIIPQEINYNVALDFANNYVSYMNDTIGKISVDDYVKQDELLSDNFKKRYKTIVDSAYKVESEVGLDFDPIIDGQDFPDKGFKIKTIDKATGFVTLKGIDWEDFELVLKVVNENEKSLVDGSGIINIPTNKQVKR